MLRNGQKEEEEEKKRSCFIRQVNLHRLKRYKHRVFRRSPHQAMFFQFANVGVSIKLSYRITLELIIQDQQIILVDIGDHDAMY